MNTTKRYIHVGLQAHTLASLGIVPFDLVVSTSGHFSLVDGAIEGLNPSKHYLIFGGVRVRLIDPGNRFMVAGIRDQSGVKVDHNGNYALTLHQTIGTQTKGHESPASPAMVMGSGFSSVSLYLEELGGVATPYFASDSSFLTVLELA